MPGGGRRGDRGKKEGNMVEMSTCTNFPHAHMYACSLTVSLARSLARSLTHSLRHSLTHSRTCSLFHLLICFLIHSCFTIDLACLQRHVHNSDSGTLYRQFPISSLSPPSLFARFSFLHLSLPSTHLVYCAALSHIVDAHPHKRHLPQDNPP